MSAHLRVRLHDAIVHCGRCLLDRLFGLASAADFSAHATILKKMER